MNAPPAELPEDEEEGDLEGDRKLLADFKETLKANNGKLPAAQTINFIRDRLLSMSCKNQGYVLDGFPVTPEDAAELFKGVDILTPALDDEAKDDAVEESIFPEFLFTVEMSDMAIKQRMMKLPESVVAGTKNSEEGITKPDNKH